MLLCIHAMGQQQSTKAEIELQDTYLRANQAKLLGKYDKAAELYQSVIESQPTMAAAHHDLARVYLALDDPDSAIKSCKKALSFAPDEVWYVVTLSEIYLATEQYSDQVKMLKKAITMSEEPHLYDRWAAAAELSGDQAEVAMAYELAMDRYGMNDDWVDALIDAYLKDDKKDKAEQLLEKYVAVASSSVERSVKLGEFYMFTKQYKKAKKVFDKVLMTHPNNESALFNQNILNRSSRKSDSKLMTMVNNPSISMDDKIKGIAQLIMTGDKIAHDQVDAAIASLKEVAPKNPKLMALNGDLYYMTGDYAKAIEHYSQAVQNDRSVYSVWSHLLECYVLTQQYDQLSERAEEVMDYYPNIAEPYYYYAYGQWGQGDTDAAQEYLDEASMIGGDDAVMAERIVLLSARIAHQSDVDEAISLLQGHLDRYSTSAIVNELLGDLYKSKGDSSNAQKHWKVAMEQGGDAQRIQPKIESL